VSYLLSHARRPGRPARGMRVDDDVRLNRPGLYGAAFVRVLVEDTSRSRLPKEPRLKLKIGDCSNVIELEFSLGTPQLRENSLFKVETLIGALQRFRDGLAAEAELAERRGR
jgi:hypothetical protein